MSIEKPHTEDDEESNWDCPSGCLFATDCLKTNTICELAEDDKRLAVLLGDSDRIGEYIVIHGSTEPLKAQSAVADGLRANLGAGCGLMFDIERKINSVEE